MAWRFEATTLGHVKQGEIELASGRTVTNPIRKTSSASFSVDFKHPQAELFTSGDCLVQVFDDTNRCMFNGPVMTAQEDASEGEQKIAVTAYGPTVDLLDRLCGKSATGLSIGTALAPVDSIAIAKQIVDGTNAEAETGIDTSGMNGTAAPTYVGPYYFKQILTVLNDLANVLDGFDWTELPQRMMNGKIAVLAAAGKFGVLNKDAAFEYGSGKHNVVSYNRPIDRTGLLNSGWSLPPGFPDNATQAIIAPSATNGTADAASIALRGLHEGVVTGDLSVDALRLKQVQENVRLRRNPRQTINFTPTSYLSGTAPVFGRDFGLGDVVPFRATVDGRKRINALLRVFGVTHTLDDVSNIATPSITLASE